MNTIQESVKNLGTTTTALPDKPKGKTVSNLGPLTLKQISEIVGHENELAKRISESALVAGFLSLMDADIEISEKATFAQTMGAFILKFDGLTPDVQTAFITEAARQRKITTPTEGTARQRLMQVVYCHEPLLLVTDEKNSSRAAKRFAYFIAEHKKKLAAIETAKTLKAVAEKLESESALGHAGHLEETEEKPELPKKPEEIFRALYNLARTALPVDKTNADAVKAELDRQVKAATAVMQSFQSIGYDAGTVNEWRDRIAEGKPVKGSKAAKAAKVATVTVTSDTKESVKVA